VSIFDEPEVEEEHMFGAGSLTMVLLAGGGLGNAATAAEPFLEALRAKGALDAQAKRMTLYDSLLGDWNVDVVDYDADGSRRTNKGEWHFAWVLEGRAMQDVLIVPPRGSREGQPIQGNRYGTTLRVYDPATDVWRITWINPVTGVTNTLTGRKQGEEIVQEGKDADGPLNRWIFSEVTAHSFRWRGEISTDEGKTWRLGAEFFGRRAAPRGARP
jgi:hypothetical protein